MPRTLDWLVRRFLLACCEIHARTATPLLVEAWLQALKGQEPSRVEPAMSRCMAECDRFPTPADVIRRIGPSGRLALAASAEEREQAWHGFLQYAKDNGNLPEGSRSIVGFLTPKQRFAGRAAGGANFVESCSEGELVWAKKRFCEAYERYQIVEGEGIESLPSEMRELFRSLADAKALPQ